MSGLSGDECSKILIIADSLRGEREHQRSAERSITDQRISRHVFTLCRPAHNTRLWIQDYRFGLQLNVPEVHNSSSTPAITTNR